MAAWTSTTSGNTTTYTITDSLSVTATVAVTQTFGAGRTFTISATGLHTDGLLNLTVLVEMLSTGLTP